jgi:hypothetical protein
MNSPIDIQVVRAEWITRFGGDYPDEFIEHYLKFIEDLVSIFARPHMLVEELEHIDQVSGLTIYDVRGVLEKYQLAQDTKQTESIVRDLLIELFGREKPCES